jgi:HD-GYP domain-containing protein (c-di-GMP phosphodiesterase class II)
MKFIDDMFMDGILKHGRPLITNFAILIKLTGIYQSINEAVINTATRMLKELSPLLGEDGELSLKLAEDSFFIENIRIKATMADLDNFTSLIKDMSSKNIGAVTFKAPLQVDDLIVLAYAIRGGGEVSEIQSQLESRMTKGISIGGPVFAKKEQSVDMKDIRVSSRRAYSRAISSYIEAMNSIRLGKKPNVKKAKRAIQSLVDCLLKDEGYMLGLTTLRNAAQYAIQHPVNVAVFSMALGQRLGLTKYTLSLIGMAALFHDIGKVEIPSAILNKSGEFSKGELELIKMHPVEGIKHILKTRGINEVSIITIFACLEHHMEPEGGYPELREKRAPLLYSRIIRIGDDFDSLVSGRVYGRTALSPARALQKMHADIGGYDGPLFKAFFEIFKRREFAF